MNNAASINVIRERIAALKPTLDVYPGLWKVFSDCFMNTLENLHISVTRRREMGDDIEGACGQLRRKTLAAQSDAAN